MSQKSNRIVGVVVALAAVASVIAAVLLAKPVATLDPASPQGAVQGYLNAVLGKDYNAALSYLDPSSGCTIKSFDSAYMPENPEVSLVSTSIDGDSAVVDVKVTYNSADLMSSSESHTYRLSRTAAGWKIANTPWPVYDCGLVK